MTVGDFRAQYIALVHVHFFSAFGSESICSICSWFQKSFVNGFSKIKNYNPMQHCKRHNWIKNDGEIYNYSFKVVDYIYRSNIATYVICGA